MYDELMTLQHVLYRLENVMISKDKLKILEFRAGFQVVTVVSHY